VYEKIFEEKSKGEDRNAIFIAYRTNCSSLGMRKDTDLNHKTTVPLRNSEYDF
jgi:hypothetical protein